MQQFNLNIEHQLPGNMVLTAGYAGSRSSHILVDGVNLNVCRPPGAALCPTYTLGCGHPNVPWAAPTFPNGPPVIDNITDTGSARYDSLQIKAETKSAPRPLRADFLHVFARPRFRFPGRRRNQHGSHLLAAAGTQKADWALSQIDLKHNLSASVIYDLPFGKGSSSVTAGTVSTECCSGKLGS